MLKINLMELLKLKLIDQRVLSKSENGEKGFTLIELIIVLVIMGIIAGIAIPKFLNTAEEARISSARAAAGAMTSTIMALHGNYLLNANDYTAADVVSNTLFESGVAAPTVAGNTITWVSGPDTFTWTYTPRSGVESARLTEDSSSAFP